MRKILFAFLVLAPLTCVAQTDAASFAAEMMRYRVETNLVYHTANNYQNKLDVYMPAETAAPVPVVLVIVALLASYVPGRRAIRINPTAAIRNE